MQVIENFLDSESIEKTLIKIKNLKNKWMRCGDSEGLIPFYTLGTARYLTLNNSDYDKAIKQNNPIIKNHFSDLLDKLKSKFEELYKKKFCFFENCGLPGFHIFENDSFFEIAFASRHCDLQYKYIDWQDIEIDPSQAISFTLYLKLPANGGGIYYWHKYHEDFIGVDPLERERILHQNTRYYKTFNEGDLFIHNGHQYHQIAPFVDIQEGDERISLQGHAIYSPNKDIYYMHW